MPECRAKCWFFFAVFITVPSGRHWLAHQGARVHLPDGDAHQKPCIPRPHVNLNRSRATRHIEAAQTSVVRLTGVVRPLSNDTTSTCCFHCCPLDVLRQLSCPQPGPPQKVVDQSLHQGSWSDSMMILSSTSSASPKYCKALSTMHRHLRELQLNRRRHSSFSLTTATAVLCPTSSPGNTKSKDFSGTRLPFNRSALWSKSFLFARTHTHRAPVPMWHAALRLIVPHR